MKQVSRRQRIRQGHVRDRAGRRRDRLARHGDRRGLGGRAIDDGDRRSRHFADGRVRRPRLLRRSAGGHLRCPGQPLDRPSRHARARRPDPAAFHFSHGDTKHILIFPSSVEECYTMAQEAFELAELFQTPVFVMMDLDLGMNNWMSNGFTYPESRSTAARSSPTSTEGSASGSRVKRRRRRRHSVPDDPGRRHARVLRARIRSQRQGAIQRASRRLRRQHGPARAQVRDGAPARAEGGRGLNRPRSDSSPMARRTTRPRRAAINCAKRPASTPRASGCARIPSPTIWRHSSTRTSASTSSSRTVTRSSCS